MVSVEKTAFEWREENEQTWKINSRGLWGGTLQLWLGFFFFVLLLSVQEIHPEDKDFGSEPADMELEDFVV